MTNAQAGAPWTPLTGAATYPTVTVVPNEAYEQDVALRLQMLQLAVAACGGRGAIDATAVANKFYDFVKTGVVK